MNILLTKQQSNMLYVAKAVSVVLIAGAHMPFGGSMPAESIRMSICQIGVVVFFVCTGFFYRREEKDSKLFWIKKSKTVIIPWVIMASATFLLSVVLSGSADGFPLSYIKWVLGIGSHYWYMTVMLICFVLFNCLFYSDHSQKIKRTGLYLCIVVSVISVLLSAGKIIIYNASFNQYTNVLNWIGWFSLGVLVREKKWLDRITSWKLFTVACSLLIVFTALSSSREIIIEAYVDMYSVPIEVCGGICVLFIAKLLCNSNVLVDIGKKSFFIYLIHIQIAGMINARLPYNAVFFVARPFVAVAVCYFSAKVFEWVLKKLKCSEELKKILALR